MALYAAFAFVWIYGSDAVVAWLFTDVHSISLASTVKGWFFVAVTSLLLFFLISRLIARLEGALHTVRERERELRTSSASLTEANSLLRATLDALPDLLFEVSEEGYIYQYHSHRNDLLAAPPEAFLGRKFSELLPADASAVCTAAISEAREKGFSSGKRYALDLPQGKRWFELSVAPMQATVQGEQRLIFISRDVTETYTAQKQYQSELEHMAHFDVLTGLPNRLLLADRIQQAMVQSERHGHKVLIAYLDLDNFKAVNDQYGREVGDQLLVVLAQRIKEHLRDGDTLARFGGDEFVVVLTDFDEPSAALPLVNRLIASASEAFHLSGASLQLSVSIGLTSYPQGSPIDAEQLLRQADQAMYQAKLAGKKRYHMFDTQRDSEVRGHFDVLERLRQALTHSEFVLYYQPKVHMRTGRVIGAEALIRWQHPERGLLSPAFFLPDLEEHPLSIEVGEWVIETALLQYQHWRESGLDIPVSVNLGALQLQRTDFVDRLQTILSRHPDVDPSRLQLEILETSALQDIRQATANITACQALGIHFALDDFGTGYSSLTYLRQLPVTVLKIDQSFVRGMLDNTQDQAILRGVLGLAHAFGREVIAEGVETEAHGTLLLQLGCEEAQGYGIARPMPGADFPLWARQWRPCADWVNAPQAPSA